MVAYVLMKESMARQCGYGRKDVCVDTLCVYAGRGESLKCESMGRPDIRRNWK
jgi:hypothetical protein